MRALRDAFAAGRPALGHWRAAAGESVSRGAVAPGAAAVRACRRRYGPEARASKPCVDGRVSAPPGSHRRLRAPRDTAALSAALGQAVQELQSRGHLEARASAAWDSLRGARLLVRIEEGPRFTLSSVTIETPGAQDSARMAHALALTPGGPASPVAVTAAIERAIETLSGDGYPYATLGVRQWQEDSTRVKLYLSGALGPGVTVTAVRVDGLRVTRPEVAKRAVGPLAGQPYRRSTAEDGRDRLEALGLFRSVAFQGLEGEPDWHGAQLVYKVEEPRYNELEGAVGVQGAAGAVGLARLNLGNLLGTGRAVALRWESRGSGVTQFDANYGEPQVFGLPLRLEGRIGQEVQDTIYVRTQLGCARRVSRCRAASVSRSDTTWSAWCRSSTWSRRPIWRTRCWRLEHSSLDAAGRTRKRLDGTCSRSTQSFKREHLRPEGEQHRARQRGRSARRVAHAAARLRAALNWEAEFGRALQFGAGAAAVRAHAARRSQDAARLRRAAVLGRSLRAVALRVGPLPRRGRTARVSVLGSRLDQHARSARRWQHSRSTLASHDGIGFGLRVETAGGLIGLDYGLEPGRPPLEGKLHLQLVSQF